MSSVAPKSRSRAKAREEVIRATAKRRIDNSDENKRARTEAIADAHATARRELLVAVPLFEKLVVAGVPVALATSVREAVRRCHEGTVHAAGKLDATDDEAIMSGAVDVSAVLGAHAIAVARFAIGGTVWAPYEHWWYCDYDVSGVASR